MKNKISIGTVFSEGIANGLKNLPSLLGTIIFLRNRMLLVSSLLVVVCTTAVAQADSTSIAPVSQSVSGGSFLDMVGQFVLAVLILAGPLFMILHMIYTLWDTKRLQRVETAEGFATQRQQKGMEVQMSDEELAQCGQYLDEAFNVLSVTESTDGENETRRPGKMRELLKSKKLVALALKMKPTDAETVERCNELNHFLYDYMKRSFNSSWKLIILAFLVAVGISFIGDRGFFKEFFTVGCFFWVPCIVYYISGNVPQYMIDKKANRGGGNGWFATALVGLGIGALGSGRTVRTHYTDGTHSDDNSSHFIALLIGVIVLFCVALTIYLWAIINYLRNYVLYI